MTKPKSGRFHWLKWWPRRWLGDTAVRACSLAARGAWVDILNVMHEEASGGVFLIAGKVPSSSTVARLLGVSEKEWLAVERELLEQGVCSRRESDGALYCRSTVRESESQGEPEENPAGVPKGVPRGTPGVPEGSPPSRALSSSCPLTSGSSGSGGVGGEGPRPRDPVLTEDDFAPPAPLRHRDGWREHLAMHPSLDVPEVRAALDRWTAHLRDGGKRPKTSGSWETSFVEWERWGPARLVAAIECTIGANAFTVFERTLRAPPRRPTARGPMLSEILDGTATAEGA